MARRKFHKTRTAKQRAQLKRAQTISARKRRGKAFGKGAAAVGGIGLAAAGAVVLGRKISGGPKEVVSHVPKSSVAHASPIVIPGLKEIENQVRPRRNKDGSIKPFPNGLQIRGVVITTKNLDKDKRKAKIKAFRDAGGLHIPKNNFSRRAFKVGPHRSGKLPDQYSDYYLDGVASQVQRPRGQYDADRRRAYKFDALLKKRAKERASRGKKK